MWWNKESSLLDLFLQAGPETPVVFIDTETTGLKNETDNIIEFSGIRRVNGTKQVIDFYIKPPFAISAKITEITGITNEMLIEKPVFEDTIGYIDDFLAGNPIIIGWNISFDIGMLAAEYQRCGKEMPKHTAVDALSIARNVIDKKDVPSYKLQDVAAYYGLTDYHFHNSFDDVSATAVIFDILVKEVSDRGFVSCGTKQPNVYSVNFWEGYKGFSRIYVQTDVGSVYYDIRRDCWIPKDADISTIDMTFVEQNAWKLTGSADKKRFKNFKGKVVA